MEFSTPENQSAVLPEDVFETLGISNRKRISEELFEKLRDAILSGALPGGYAFPNENALCKKLDIGRSTLREAYAPLETMHLITRTKMGTYVNDASDTRNAMNFDIIAQYTDPANMIEYRRIMEVGVTQLAAQKATPDDTVELMQIVDEMEKSAGDTEALTQLDFAFHSTLAKISKNELLMISFNTIRIIYEKFVMEQFSKNLLPQSLKDHRALIEALSKNDTERAGELMREHLTHIESAAKGK